jgi:hypothetical protein
MCNKNDSEQIIFWTLPPSVDGWMDGARTLSQPQLILTGRLVGFRENALHAMPPSVDGWMDGWMERELSHNPSLF